MSTTTHRPLVLGEIAKVEELSGTPATQWDDAPQGKLLAALVFVYKRRETKDFTWNDAMALTADEARDFLKTYGVGDDEGDVEDPTEPAKKPARSKSASKTSGSSSASSD